MKSQKLSLFSATMFVAALAALPALAQPCEVVDNGTGTVDLPPIGGNCGYLSPDDVHLIIAGLPAGTTIEVAAEHNEFFQVQRFPGGNLGGEVEQFQSILLLELTGTGALAGFQRTLGMQAASEVHTGPRNAGDPVQTFPNEMVFLQGEIFGDPDFDILRIEAGTAFGLPSPGSTTLTQLPSGNFNVDSFFDIEYRIEFVGAPGSILEGLGGVTTDTVTMGAGEPPPPDDPCVVPDNGNGTVTLPPEGCAYLSPDEVHVIIDGLPPGTEIILEPIHDRFINIETQPGGNLGGEIEVFNSDLTFQATGTGALTGFNRILSIPMASETHTGPRTPGDPVQTFPNDMFQQQGEIFGDPDFDLLRVTAGTANGLPSPGETTLTRLGPPGSDFQVDSFFDITYRIDFQGAPGSILDGLAGSTTGTVGMQAGVPSEGCQPIPPGTDVFPSTAKLVVRRLDGTDTEPVVVRLSDVGLSDTVVERQGEDTQQRTVQTEILSMDLSGSHPALGGDVRVRVGSSFGLPPSTGELRDVEKDPASCEFRSADSFFDVFTEVTLVGTNQILRNEQPLRLQRKIHTLPPKDEPYENPFVQPVVLFDQQTGQPVAEILYERHHADPPPPPPDNDCFDTFLQAQIDLPPLGLFGHPLFLQGPTTVRRGPPSPLGLVCCATGIPCLTDAECAPTDSCSCAQFSIQNELTEMDMDGFDPLLGEIQLRPTPGVPSQGQTVNRQHDRTYPVDSFFDVFFDITLVDQGVNLHSDGHLTVSNIGSSGKDGVRNTPPDPGTDIGSGDQDVVLLVDDGGQPIGQVYNVHHIIDPPRDWQPPPPPDEDCFDSWVHIRITVFNPFCEEDLWLPGHFRVLRDSPRDPAGIGQEIIDTIMAKGLFSSNSDCVGPLTARMSGDDNRASRGEVSSLAPAEFFPADSFFDVYVELDTGIGPLHTQQPVHMTTTVNSLPPEDGEIYFGPGTVIPLFDETGQQIGEILEVAHEIHEEVECPAACKAHIEFGTALAATAPGGVDPKSVIDVGIPDGGGGVTYDVARGNLIHLRNTGGSFDSAFCLQNDGPPIVIDTEIPGLAIGGYFYVARDTFGDYVDTWNSLGPSQVGDRDLKIPNAICP